LILYPKVNCKSIDKIYIKLLTLTICVETFVNVGYFFRIGNYDVLYSEGVIGIIGILSIIIIVKRPINTKMFILGMMLICSVIISSITLLGWPADYEVITYGMSWYDYFYNNMSYPEFTLQTIKMAFRIVLYVIIATATVSTMKVEYLKRIVKSFITCGSIIIYYSLLEFIIKNILKSNVLNNFIYWFFGVGDSTLINLLERGSIYSLQGFMREPSHLAASMFLFGLTVVFSHQQQKTTWKLLLCTFGVMLLSRSFAGVLYILAIYTMYAIVNNKKVIFSCFALCIVPIILWSSYFEYYSDRIINVMGFINSKEASIAVSEHIRLLSAFENLKAFIYRPLFGIGIGTSYAYAFFPSLLSNMGLIGCLSWLIFMFKGIGKIRLENNILIILVLIITWSLNGNMGDAYSMGLLLIMLQIRYKVIGINTYYRQQDKVNENIMSTIKA